MNRDIIQQEIAVLLDTIQEQTVLIFKNGNRIPQLEIDIIKSNIRELYDKFYEIEKEYRNMDFGMDSQIDAVKKEIKVKPKNTKLNSPKDIITFAKIDEPVAPVEIKFEPVDEEKIIPVEVVEEESKSEIEEKVTEEIKEESKDIAIEVIKEEIVEEIIEKLNLSSDVINEKEEVKEEESKPLITATHELKPEVSNLFNEPEHQSEEPKEIEKVQKPEEVKQVKQEVKKDNSNEIKSQPHRTQKNINPVSNTGDLFATPTLTIGDTLKQEKQTLLEKLTQSGKEDKSVASKLQNNPISDIKKAIGINEKFQFINELFRGHIQDYNEVITALNNFSGANEANIYFNQLKEKYNWNDDNESAKTLSDIIQRRYPA
ncbi:MAG: hypothetical protein Q8880_00835 [Bacteroidota bacterium]|nr:hypothetical protein [Bacteroidota bacterium]